MERRTFLFGALALGAPVTILGCGGGGVASSGGGGNSGGDPGRTRQEVVDAIKDGFGVFKSGKSSGSRLRPTRSGSPTFDEFYQLWVLPVENGRDFFEDEACTLTAGSDRYTRVYAENGSDFEARGQFSITKGPRAGAAGTSSVSNTPGLYTFRFEGNIPGQGSYRIVGRWDENGGGYETFSDAPDTGPRYYKCFYRPDGTSKLEFTNQRGLEFALEFTAERSGTGVVRGSDPALFPGTVTWDVDGNGAVVFADGSRVEFQGLNLDNV